MFFIPYKTVDRQIDDINVWKKEGMGVISFYAK